MSHAKVCQSIRRLVDSVPTGCPLDLAAQLIGVPPPQALPLHKRREKEGEGAIIRIKWRLGFCFWEGSQDSGKDYVTSSDCELFPITSKLHSASVACVAFL